MTVSSMTGFAHEQIQTVLGVLSIDLKSVNSRYQEITIRLPEELRFLEGEIRSVISQSVARGKIECRMQWVADLVHEQTFNQEAIKNLFSLQYEITKQHPEIKPLTVSQILSFPGILEPKTVDIETLKQEVMNGLQQAIQIFLLARSREGASLAKVVLSYCDKIEETVNQLIPKLPNIIENIQKKYDADRRVEAYRKARYEQGADELKDWLEALKALNDSRLSVLERKYGVISASNAIWQAMGGRIFGR